MRRLVHLIGRWLTVEIALRALSHGYRGAYLTPMSFQGRMARSKRANAACEGSVYSVFSTRLGADLPQRLGWNMIKLLQDTGHHRYEVFHPVAYRLHHEYGNRQSGKVLLELEVTVHREERIELGGSES
jgi:hypothetical protein